MATLSEIRSQYPQYNDMSDAALADALYSKFYSDIPREEFNRKVGIQAERRSITAKMPSADKQLATSQSTSDISNNATLVGVGDAWKSAGSGLSMGVADPVIGGAQMLAHGLSGAAPNGSGLQDFAKGKSVALDMIARDREAKRQAERGPNATAVDVPRMIGNMIPTAPLAFIPGGQSASMLPRVGSGMASGGISAALQPVTQGEYGAEKTKQIATGMLAGGAVPLVTGAAARVANPQPSANVRALLDENVALTPGQRLGGVFRRVEDASTSIPILGDAIKSAQRNSLETFNRAAVNRSLAPIGQALPDNIPVGFDAIQYAHKTLSDSYDNILPKMAARADQQFNSEMSNLIQLSQNMKPEVAKQFQNIVNNELGRKIPQSGVITGQTYKEAESQFTRLASKFGKSQDGNDQLLGDALEEANRILRETMLRHNPTLAPQIRANNKGWANLVRVEKAAVGGVDGVFTPAKLNQVVTSPSNAFRSQAATGNALMQDLSNAGKDVLPSTISNSGTMDRMLVNGGNLAALGGGLTQFPLTSLGIIGGQLAGASLYTKPGQRALGAALSARPQSAPAIAQGIRQASPYLATAASPLALYLGNQPLQ